MLFNNENGNVPKFKIVIKNISTYRKKHFRFKCEYIIIGKCY